MNKKVFSYFILVSLFLVKCNAMEQPPEKEITEDFHYSDINVLTVENDRGSISITGWDYDFFKVTTRKESSSRALLSCLRSTISRENNAFNVRGIVEPYSESSLPAYARARGGISLLNGAVVSGNVSLGNITTGIAVGDKVPTQEVINPGSIHYRIFAPQFLALKIFLKTHDGDVSVKAYKTLCEWNAVVKTDNGTIEAEGIESLDAETSNKAIKVKNILGKVCARNTWGEITITDANEVDAQTSYADLHIRQRDNATGDVTAVNNNGVISVGNLVKELHAETVSENIYYNRNPNCNRLRKQDVEAINGKVIRL